MRRRSYSQLLLAAAAAAHLLAACCAEAPAQALVWDSPDDAVALAADDECGGVAGNDGEGACAVSALQLRGAALVAQPDDALGGTSAADSGDGNVPATPAVDDAPVVQVPEWMRNASQASAAGGCAATYVPSAPNWNQDCRGRPCCDRSLRCYQKVAGWAGCMRSCTPGIHYEEPPQFRAPWSCRVLWSGAPAPAPPTTTRPTPPPTTTPRPTTTQPRPPAPAPPPPTTRPPAPAPPPSTTTSTTASTTTSTTTTTTTSPKPAPAPAPSPPWLPPAPAPTVAPPAELSKPSNAPTYTFYMYRAVGPNNYPFENVNAGNLAGVLWYLNNEVVITSPRKYGITRIIRIRVHTRAPQPLADKGMNFGVRYAFDSGKCTGPFDCGEQFRRYGYFVGCNNLGDFPFPTYPVHYPDAVWYSLPGKCPSRSFPEQDASCRAGEPGGACEGTPTGTGDCTYSYERAGEITLDELEGGRGQDFWAGLEDDSACQYRLARARALFSQKYGGLDLPNPRCDFNRDLFYS